MEINPSEDPIELFQQWLKAASATEPADPEAMALATVDKEGHPSVRMVLLKGVDGQGFCFYTNMESKKARELAGNPQAAVCFYWKSQKRQVRVEGRAEEVAAPLADAYFKTRQVLSRLGAWASRQSQPIASRAALEAQVAIYEKKFSGHDIPRPPQWSGYRIIPEKIEFWQEGKGRLHDRFLFTRAGPGWSLARLSP